VRPISTQHARQITAVFSVDVVRMTTGDGGGAVVGVEVGDGLLVALFARAWTYAIEPRFPRGEIGKGR